MAFAIEYSFPAREQLKGFRKRDQQIIVDEVDIQLSYEPDRPTRRRKRLEQNPIAPWVLRVGDFRVFYDVNTEDQLVVVLGVGRKIHDRLFIGGEEVKL